MKADGWKVGRLGELCNISIGGTPSRSNPLYWNLEKSTKNLWVSIKDMNSKLIEDTAEYLTEEGVRNSNVKLLGRGTVLLSFKLTIGKVSIAGNDLYTNEAIAGLASQKVSHQFLYHGLQQWDLLQGVDQAIKGATLNKQKLNKIQFIYPPDRQEQEQIAKVLSTLDRAIEQTEAIIAKQQRIKTGLMQDLLTKGIDENGNIRSEETHEFKDSEIGRIPVEWEVKQISSVLASSPKNGYSPQEVDDWQGIYMLGLGCLTSEGFQPIQLKKAPASDLRISSAFLKDGDFLISRSNTRNLVGLVGIFSPIGEPCIYPDLMVRLQFVDTVNVSYMQHVFLSSIVRSQFQNAATGTSGSMVKINSQIIKDCFFPRPSMSEQYRILNLLEKKSEFSNICFCQLYKLKSQKRGLMQDLLTGKIRVTPLLQPGGDSCP